MNRRLGITACLAMGLSACGGSGSPNTAPSLQAIDDQIVLENADSSLAALVASDIDGDYLTFRLSGPDAAHFVIRG